MASVKAQGLSREGQVPEVGVVYHLLFLIQES